MHEQVEPSQIIDENDCFYFESDHLALKGNKDYGDVLKTLFVLESQRSQLLKDYETVAMMKQQALNDPLSIVEKLKRGESLNLPDVFNVPEIPKINWTKYNCSIASKILKDINSENKYKESDVNLNLFKHSKKQKIWTLEEQKKLEDLLNKYPPEAVEMQRFKKIADDLGSNTTSRQVASRVQKYFTKLYKLGLPIPGRAPRSVNRQKSHKHQQYNHFLIKPSTFFPELAVPVKMDDNDECPGPSVNAAATSSSQNSVDVDAEVNGANPDNYLLHNAYPANVYNNKYTNKSTIELQVQLLKRIKYEKMKMDSTSNPYQHSEFSCDFCNEEPIIGTRWHCVTCVNSSVDYCTDCMISQMSSEQCHPVNHHFLVVRDNCDQSNGSSMSESSSDEEESESDIEEDGDTSDVDTAIKMEPEQLYQQRIEENSKEDEQPSGSGMLTTLNSSNYHEIFTHTQDYSKLLDADSLLFDE